MTEIDITQSYSHLTPDVLVKSSMEWKGDHKSTGYSIRYWGVNEYNPKGVWNYYVYLYPEQWGEETFNKFVLEPYKEYKPGLYLYNYDNFSIYEFHGGPTYYKKHVCPETLKVVSVEVGCDYSHLFDERCYYNFDSVKRECLNTIDLLHEYNNNVINYRCGYDGKWRDRDEFIHCVNIEDPTRTLCYHESNEEHISLKYWEIVKRPEKRELLLT